MSAITDQIDVMAAAIERLRALVAAPAAPYSARTDRTPQPKPTLPVLGPAGFSFEDPTFGRRILRVTDATMGGSSWRVSSNAHVAAWNADSSKFYVVNAGGGIQLFAFDAAAFQALPVASPYSQTEPDFSRVDPDVLFTVAGPKTRTIRRYSLTAGSATDAIDLDALGLPNLNEPRTYCGAILSAGQPELIVALFGGTGQDQHRYVLRGPLTGAPAQIFDSRQRLGTNLHACAVDRSGRYVLLYPPIDPATGTFPPGIAQVYLWDTTTDSCLPMLKNPAGHAALGYGLLVNQDQGGLPYDACQWQLRELAHPDVTRDLIDPVMTPKEIYFADHTSWQHAKPDVRVPVISATYRYGTNDVPWRAWDDEIIGIATQGESTVWRFAHHRSYVSAGFWSQPLLSVAPNGKYAVFSSNWEQTLGVDGSGPRQDVFVLELK